MLRVRAVSLSAQQLGPERNVAEFAHGAEGWPSNAQSIVPDGDGYIVFWFKVSRLGSAEPDVMATRVRASDGVRTNEVTLFRGLRAWSFSASLTSANTYLIAYTKNEGTFVGALDRRLAVIAEPRRVSELTYGVDTACSNDGAIRGSFERPERYCTASGSGTRYVLACVDQDIRLNVAAIDESGVQSANVLVGTASGDRSLGSLSVASSGTAPQNLQPIRAASDPVSVKPESNLIADCVSNGGNFVVAWNHGGGLQMQSAYATTVSADGRPTDETALRTGPLDQQPLSIARSGTGALVV